MLGAFACILIQIHIPTARRAKALKALGGADRLRRRCWRSSRALLS